MIPFLSLLVYAACLALAALALQHTLLPFLALLWRQSRSPLRHLPGPPASSFLLGNLAEMHDQENTDLVPRWAARYGAAFVYRGFIGGCRLMLTDERAVAHVLANAYDYPKPDFVRDSLATMAAGHEGLLTVEGEVHRRQRKIINPAFSAASIKAITPIFWDKAIQLRDILALHAPPTTSAARPPRTDVLAWLTRATLDVIGLAGFGYTFDALAAASPSNSNSKGYIPSPPASAASSEPHFPTSQPFTTSLPLTPTLRRRQPPPSSPPPDPEKRAGAGEELPAENELARAFSTIFSTARRFRAMTILQVWFPFLRRFRRNSAAMKEAHDILDRIGRELIREKTAAIEAERAGGEKRGEEEDGIEGDRTGEDRDLLSVLIRSNLAATPAQRMSTAEVLCQISTFIAAGHETTSNALSWTLYALARDGRVQDKLRAEVRAFHLHHPSPHLDGGEGMDREERRMDGDVGEGRSGVLGLPYLDAVVRESLRLHAPITSTMRVCARAGGDAIPTLGAPVRINEGDIISVPIQAVNRSERVWGRDAGEFRPERWEEPATLEGTRGVPGLYAHILTFLNGNPLNGNRACIGWKFALTEMKIFLFVLIRELEFTMDPRTVIEKKVNVVTRPFVKSEPELGNQMPLYIRRVAGAPPP